MTEPIYRGIVDFCEACFEEHGDSYLGAGWTRSAELADLRYQVVLDLVPAQGRPASLLDFGCGAGRLYDYLKRTQTEGIEYAGLDVSERVLEFARGKYPEVSFYRLDLLEAQRNKRPVQLPVFDYVVMNGVFSYRGEIARDDMVTYQQELIVAAAEHARRGLAWNVMSTWVDWERDDLFHVPLDETAEFVTRTFGREFVIRHDYQQFEYTVYVYL